MKRMKIAACLLSLLMGLLAVGCNKEIPEEVSTPPPAIEEPIEIPEELPRQEEPQEQPQAELPQTEEPQVPTVPTQAEVKAQYLRVTGENVNIRSGAGTGYEILGKAEKNTLFAYTGEKSGWYETYCRGRKAYISKQYVSLYETEKADEDTENVIAEGMKLLGVPYVYGAVRLHDGAGNFLKGFTKEKFDCSSLMQYIFYYGKGALLSLTTRTQVSQGRAVSDSAMKRGDLLFFTNASRANNTGIERVGHVALYLGDGYILHTASDYAKVEKMSATRRSYFICARRV